jgi:lysophospholipase L1-like esterase
MYRFQIGAYTRPGESIGLVGNIPELGNWDPAHCRRLYTQSDRFPLWWTELDLPPPEGDRIQVAYKYIHISADGQICWEAPGENRWVPLETDVASAGSTLVIDDGVFSYIQPYPISYFDPPLPEHPPASEGCKVLILGSSVAAGHRAWRHQGWAQQLAHTLQHRGYRVINRSEPGASVTRTIARFAEVVVPEQPDIVILSLSLGNEGFAHCSLQERWAIQQRFEQGLRRLVALVQAVGAQPVVAGLYAHSDYSWEHCPYLRDTQQRMQTWGVPVIDWLGTVADEQGRWLPKMSADPAHPNTLGHQQMYGAAIALFDQQPQLGRDRPATPPPQTLYRDDAGFQITLDGTGQLEIRNASDHDYSLTPTWTALQAHLRQAHLIPGLYLSTQPQATPPPFLVVQGDGAIATPLVFPAQSHATYQAAYRVPAPDQSTLLFYDGQLGIVKQDDQRLWVLNESEHEFNIHPMWQTVRQLLRAMPMGVYGDPLYPDAPFRTMMIGPEGLESRVKVPPYSALLLQYQCTLQDINRVAILPLGDRCAVRMMLYKMGYDGPAFPFDLTRTTRISDVADIISSRFTDMWNPALLHYSPEAGRIYHQKWTGLSFAHEVEDTDQPQIDMSPVYARMKRRYKARSDRFWYTLQHCDKVLFVRTGWADRLGVMDLVEKLTAHCQGKPFRLLLLSPQDSMEFADLPQVLHYNQEFNPDRMYADLDHWLYCTNILRGILDSLGISSKNLFWCPPHIPTPAT